MEQGRLVIFLLFSWEEEVNLILFVLFVLYVHLYLIVPNPDTYITGESYLKHT